MSDYRTQPDVRDKLSDFHERLAALERPAPPTDSYIGWTVMATEFVSPFYSDGSAAYYKDQVGNVHLRGTVFSPNNDQGAVFVLPEGYRPGQAGRVTVPALYGATDSIPMYFFTDGTFSVARTLTAHVDVPRFWIDNVHFRPD